MKNRFLPAALFVATLQLLPGCVNQPPASMHPDFSGMWELSSLDEVSQPQDHAEYTEEGLRRLNFYKNNFDITSEAGANFCDTVGMPWTMLGRARTYLRENYQTEDRIIHFFEYMDLYRQIYLDRTEVPENFPGTQEGYSIGHWEGDELVIKTTHLTASTEAELYQRSAEAEITERWRLIDHPTYGKSLEVLVEMNDPVIYKKPVHARVLYKRAAKGSVMGAYDCPTTMWQEFIDQRKEEIESRQKAAQNNGSQ